MLKDKILIIGGYGAVGKIMASHLSRRFPDKVIIAGRNIDKANALAAQLEYGVTAKYIDVTATSTFTLPEDIKMVIMCLDVPNTKFVDFCINHGIDYMDITANYAVMQSIATLNMKAKQNNVGLYLSIGLAPGLSNLLASYISQQMKIVENIDIYILLGLGEAHGDKAFQWTFDNINSKYFLHNGLQSTMLTSFTDGKFTDLLGRRKFYLFNFSDQHIISNTLNVSNVRTRLAFDINILTRLIAWMRSWRLSGIYKYAWVQRVMTKFLKKAYIGNDIYGVKVVAKSGTNSLSAQVSGHEEGKITALVAVLVATQIYDQKHNAGLQHIHQLITDTPTFLKELQQLDASFKFSLK